MPWSWWTRPSAAEGRRREGPARWGDGAGYGPCVDPDADLTTLLDRGERATFHGRPMEAVALLEQAVVLAQTEGRTTALTRVAWLLGMALAAGGRYGAALTVLSPLAESGSEPDATRLVYASLAGASIASVHRQLGRHGVAQQADLTALALGEGDDQATASALLGLAADAVGLGDADEAGLRVAQALTFLPPEGASVEGASVEGAEPASLGDGPWRPWVRVDWVRAEIALLQGHSRDAVLAATAAVQRAEQASAPRHVAKGLLLLGIAQLHAWRDDPAGAGQTLASQTLDRAASLAEELGALPLIWPTRALLGALGLASEPPVGPLAPDGRGRSDLGAARTAVLTIAGDLPPGVRAEWLARPDIAALLAR